MQGTNAPRARRLQSARGGQSETATRAPCSRHLLHTSSLRSGTCSKPFWEGELRPIAAFPAFLSSARHLT
eukprot:scaffold20825_cov64-Phaeocystis_antarctica.AAC.3